MRKLYDVLLCNVLFVGCGPGEPQAKPKLTHAVIAEACIECDGDGKVVYGDDHPIVKSGAGESGEYSCPMCGGSGTLYADVTK